MLECFATSYVMLYMDIHCKLHPTRGSERSQQKHHTSCSCGDVLHTCKVSGFARLLDGQHAEKGIAHRLQSIVYMEVCVHKEYSAQVMGT